MITKTKKNSTKNVTPMSVQEFKMWIKGLSDFQDDSWSPNKPQWEHIRLLIDSLSDTVVVTNRPQSQQPIRQPVAPMGETAVLADNLSQPMTQPVQQRFLGGQSDKSKSTGEHDEFGHPVLKSAYNTGSDFA
jgi:hypothetical protein